MTAELVTRRRLGRELVLNAASKRLNVGVGGAVLVAALVFQTVWLVPVAVLVYLGMLIATLFDAKEAERVGKATYDRLREGKRLELDPAVFAPAAVGQFDRVRKQEAQIRVAAEGARLAPTDLVPEVEKLVDGYEALAARAQRLRDYLGDGAEERAARQSLRRLQAGESDDPATAAANAQAIAAIEDQLKARGQLTAQLGRVEAQMEHIAATLGTIHAQVVRMSVTEEASGRPDASALVRDLQREVSAAVDALEETYGGDRPG
jgi:hypothetical protein